MKEAIVKFQSCVMGHGYGLKKTDNHPRHLFKKFELTARCVSIIKCVKFTRPLKIWVCMCTFLYILIKYILTFEKWKCIMTEMLCKIYQECVWWGHKASREKN